VELRGGVETREKAAVQKQLIYKGYCLKEKWARKNAEMIPMADVFKGGRVGLVACFLWKGKDKRWAEGFHTKLLWGGKKGNSPTSDFWSETYLLTGVWRKQVDTYCG